MALFLYLQIVEIQKGLSHAAAKGFDLYLQIVEIQKGLSHRKDMRKQVISTNSRNSKRS